MNYSTRELTAPSAASPLGSTPAAEAVIAVVPRAMRQIRSVARSVTSGLSVPQFRALRYIDRHPLDGLTPLADHLGVSLPAASALVGRLVASGLVARQHHPEERRRITLELTREGRSRIAASSDAVQTWWRNRLAGLTEAEIAALVAGLGVLDGVLSEPDQSPLEAEVVA